MIRGRAVPRFQDRRGWFDVSSEDLEILGPSDLEAYIRRSGITAELVEVGAGATSDAAAKSLDSSLNSIVKSVLFMDENNRPLLVIMGGEHRLQQSAFARLSKRKRVRLATKAEVVRYTGYPVGGVPPFGIRPGTEVFVDKRVMRKKIAFAGGGSERHLLRFEPAQLKRLYPDRFFDLPVKDKEPS